MKNSKEEALGLAAEMEKTFAQAETARKVHNFKDNHFILDTMKNKLRLIHVEFLSSGISKTCPMAHLVPDIKDTYYHGDSSLGDSTGGWSIIMKFWWWINWDKKK